MKLIALCGAAGAGKDTVADMLPARKLAFADTLYAEVAAAFGLDASELKCRAIKETPIPELAQYQNDDEGFDEFVDRVHGVPWNDSERRSPRQILQWWGDYRRAQEPDYFVNAVLRKVGPACVITDVRFPNEAALVRQLGGQLWQILRPGYEAGGTGHASDTDGSEFRPEVVLENFGSLDDLRRIVLDAWSEK